MRTYNLILVFLIITFCQNFYLQAQQKYPGQAPLNDNYIDFINQPDTYKGNSYVPMPLQLQFSKRGTDYQKSSQDKELPSGFDLRDEGFVSPVKDQEAFGSCWSFATMGAIEAHWKRLGLGIWDLSEKNLVTCHGFEWHFSEKGGNYQIAFAYLNRRDGPITESKDPYSTLDNNSMCVTSYQPDAFVDEIRYIPSDPAAIKQTILNFGAVASLMAYGSGGSESPYFSPDDNTFWYNGTAPTDHGILIVGWDDDKVITRGTRRNSISTTGAWIVKNSWGSDWGDNGFFYVAYDDTRILTENVIFPTRSKYDPKEHLYFYDELGPVTSFRGHKNTGYGLVKFEIPGNELITKVGTFLNSSGAQVEIELYDDFNAGTGKLSDLLAESGTQHCGFPGYYTFELPAKNNGDVFVKIKYHTPGYEYPIPAEIHLEGYAHPGIEYGVCWMSEDGKTWEAVGRDKDKEADVSVRLYTKDLDGPVALFSTDKKQICVNSPVKISNKAYGKITEYQWNFGEDASIKPVVSGTGKDSYQVSYSAPGEKVITYSVFGENSVDTYSARISVIEGSLTMSLTTDKSYISMGKSGYLYAIGDADEFIWPDSEELEIIDNHIAKLTPSVEGDFTYEVTGIQGQCSGKSSILVKVRNGPENDDAKDAISLQYGHNGPFTNEYASVEENEPYPDTTKVLALTTGSSDPCNSQITWCHEGGLQNSVWFTFQAPESGLISIDSYGFDNQMALYDANSYEDLFEKGAYTLLAANDDFHPIEKNFSARITSVENLTPGKTYWLQVDGSHGGDIGEFTIELYDYKVNVEKLDFKNSIHVYPNPVESKVFVKLPAGYTPKQDLRLCTIAGQVLKVEPVLQNNNTLEFDMKSYPNGIYYIITITNSSIVSKKIIK